MLDLLFPPVCIRCGLLLSVPASPEFCSRCGVDVVPIDPARATLGQPPVTALFEYGGALSAALARFKYRGELAPLGPLARALADHTPPRLALSDFDLAVCVPTHWRRRLWRGYDHVALLAQYAWPALDHPPPLHPGLLLRRHPAPPQASLPAAARAHAQRGAVGLRPRGARRVAGRRVLVIDDVVTTGATMRACFAPLLAAGASAVAGLALLRADK